MGGVVMGIRKKLVEKGIVIEEKEEGIMVRRMKLGEEKWRIIGI